MFVRFWGVRGGIAAPGKSTLKFGGNTACTEVRIGGESFVLDCGTGSRELGREMMAHAPVRMHLLFSDYRWDHIQGFPFFTPVYIPTSEIHVHGPVHGPNGVREMLSAQMKFPVFPIQLDHLNAKFSFHDVKPGEHFRAGAIEVSTAGSPDGQLAWRLEAEDGKSFVYLPDHAHEAGVHDELVEFSRKATVLVFNGAVDASLNGKRPQATREIWEEAVSIARASKAKRLIVFHHAPDDDDRAIEALERRAKKSFASTIAAYEGLRLSV